MADDIKKQQNIESIDLRKEVPGQSAALSMERPELPENSQEQLENTAKQPEKPALEARQEGQAGPGLAASVLPGGAPAPDLARQKQIEGILARDLDALYLAMDEPGRRSFKAKGEETARAINALIAAGKATAAKVLDLVKRWLMLIPGVNRFFLEQETKIKTDEILGLK